MNELIKILTGDLSISENEAKKIVILVSNYLNDKLPEPLATQIDAILGTSDVSEEELRELGLFRIP